MANFTQTLLQSSRLLVLHLVGDNTNENSVIKVDKSTLVGPNGNEPSRLVIERLEWVIGVNGDQSNPLSLEWQHINNDVFAFLNFVGSRDYSQYGGLVDPGPSGGTGDILLSNRQEVYDILMVIRKED